MMAMMDLLAQSNELTEFQRALRDHFREGGSVGAFLLTAAGLAAFIMVVYALVRWQQRAATPAPVKNDPKRLYLNLLKKLNLGREQTDWLVQAARRAGLPHPALILICEQTFDECAAAGPGDTESTAQVPRVDTKTLRRRLFGG